MTMDPEATPEVIAPEEKDYRGFIAIIITIAYFSVLGLILYYSATAKAFTVEQILALAGILGQPLAWVLAWYFKQA